MSEFLGLMPFSKRDVSSLMFNNKDLTSEDIERLKRYSVYWDFYEGYHWQDEMSDGDSAQVTLNYCRAFVNKFVAFELGKGFAIKMKPHIEPYVLPFLNAVWDDNNMLKFCNELGQMKSVTGDCWTQVFFEAPGTLDDPFGEYEKGRIRVIVISPDIVFPEYDSYDRDKLIRLKIMYPIETKKGVFGGTRKVMYKQIWTTEQVDVYEGDELVSSVPNKYGFIPFVQFKNLILAGKNYGVSDLEDLIPLNTELNIKSSDVSEIIDYHSAPVTLIFGARVGQLEKGANKVWGGLPEKARVENLELKGDLGVSQAHIDRIKKAMHEISGIPESALGKSEGISNTSGVALQIALMPLIEKVRVKQALTSEALEKLNKMIIKIGLEEGLLELPKTVTVVTSEGVKEERPLNMKDVYDTEIVFEDALPKDTLVLLQQIAIEMKLGLCDREEAMQRLGKDNIQERLKKIDKDRLLHPTIYGLDSVEKWMELHPDEVFPPQEGTSTNTKSKVGVMNRDIAENKNHQDAEVNAGFTNTTVPRMSKVGL